MYYSANRLEQNLSGRTKLSKMSSTHYILSGLIPYTDANVRLAFKPASFFREIAQLQKLSAQTLRNSYGRAVKAGLIELDDAGMPSLTAKGQRRLAPFRALSLEGAQLMVIFDIPEAESWKRQKFRICLREFRFYQVQKSVWVSDLDCQEYIVESILDLNIKPYVKIYESKIIETPK